MKRAVILPLLLALIACALSGCGGGSAEAAKLSFAAPFLCYAPGRRTGACGVPERIKGRWAG